MTSASSAAATPAPRPPVAQRAGTTLAAILSDHPGAIAEIARSAGIAADCATAGTAWLLPRNAPEILFLDLPLTGITPRRLSLLLRQLCRAVPGLVILAHNPDPALPCDIEVDDLSEDSIAEALAEACHLLRPVPARPALFHRHSLKRLSLFR